MPSSISACSRAFPYADGVLYERRATNHQPPSRLTAPTRSRAGTPLLTHATVTARTGRDRLTGVELRHHDGRTTTLRCDTVVFTGDWIPDHLRADWLDRVDPHGATVRIAVR
ncbi:hypothetical protein [Streptomyces sp. NBC_01618]|uniref:hypothetical protein n=1 Tax=Streptomyces sp. NBC_01618 TaxID=2975900 RepID=UPI00386AF5BD